MLTRADFRVAWICALPLEVAACVAVLDEHYPRLPARPGDSNAYEFGRIGPHNVVVACLPSGQFSPAAAASVAEELKISFGSARFCLLVGIGGGLPSSKADIRLGDVVVCKPSNGNGGVLAYDLGKALPGGKFEITASLNAPPKPLLTALTLFQSRGERHAHEFTGLLSPIPQGLPLAYGRPGPDRDKLFDEEYSHEDVDDLFCNKCNLDRLVTRNKRESGHPAVYYGTIGSGGSVISDVSIRNYLKDELKIICVETEAAGLMNHFPCLVIRGISDYADSHKNKVWYRYAALAASAVAKELLGIVAVEEVTEVIPIAAPRPSESFLVFTEQPVPPRAVGLGWLVLNPLSPGDDHCRLETTLTEFDVTETQQRRIHEVRAGPEGIAYRKLLDQQLSALRSDATIDDSVHVKSSFVLNSGYIFRKICQQDRVRTWCEMVIKHKFDFYMVVGIQTIDEGSPNGPTGIDLQSGFVQGKIISIQYRKVCFSLDSCSLDQAHLEVGPNRWVAFTIRMENEECDVISADLKADITKADITFSNNVELVDGQLVVFG